MTSQTTERAFERVVEATLINNGWQKADASGWDVDNAIFPQQAVDFIKATQADVWAKVAALHGANAESQTVQVLTKTLDDRGTLDVLRHGFRFSGQTLRVAFFKPANDLNPDTLANYHANRLTITRQVPCHPNRGHTVDLLFALNGLPVATCELKNPMTGQSWENAVRQYRKDRDANAPLFKERRRAVVHFAADYDQVHMATSLNRDKTRFLPFNMGSAPGEMRCGAGNPVNPDGYNTDYFWKEVLKPDQFLEIFGYYMFVEETKQKEYTKSGPRTVTRKTTIFPRYHQLDAVTKLIAAAEEDGPGHNYLIQHSAGSGKTNSISWLAYKLSNLHDNSDNLIFDCVVVISDRTLLVNQLQDAIQQIERVKGVVKRIDQDSKQLTQALVDGSKIVITTIQKFPFVIQSLLNIAGAESPDAPSEVESAQAKAWRAQIAGRNYAIIVDEAHSSQSGTTARDMKAILGTAGATDADPSQDPEDIEDALTAMAESKGPQPNLSFFAFTATPKAKTIELFGTQGPDGKPHSFHLYSMRQAIEEKFILSVLERYTDYDTYYKLNKQAQDDPDFPKRRAAAALAKFASLHPHNIAQRTEVIIEHFREHVGHLMGGQAKAMVVTDSRIQAVRYKLAFEKYIQENGYTDVSPLIAFSGTVTDPDTGTEFTEPGMNTDVVTGHSIRELELPDRFDSPDYNVLLAADKYQTGFDQPKLQAMYVDKRLDGVQAVQTLSRLNRTASGKQDPFVLDFRNNPEDIVAAFAPYYDRTEIEETTDPYRLDQLRAELDDAGIYRQDEVDDFAKVYFSQRKLAHRRTHAALQAKLQPALQRYRAADDEAAVAFRDKLNAFYKLYAFLSQIIPYADGQLEKLALFARFLIPYLKTDGTVEPIDIGDHVDLESYRLERKWYGALVIDGENTVSGPAETGTRRAEEEKAPLSQIIEILNEHHGMNLGEEDRLFFQQVVAKATNDEQFRILAAANEYDKFELAVHAMIDNIMVQMLSSNGALVNKYMTDGDAKRDVFPVIARSIFDRITETPQLYLIEEAHVRGLGYSQYADEVNDYEALPPVEETDPVVASLRQEFAELVATWRAETAGLSSPRAMARHHAYQRIIDLGEPAIPLILQDMKENGGWWDPALRALTGQNPVPESARGSPPLNDEAWLQWGLDNGYV